jgi:hypothetical protein
MMVTSRRQQLVHAGVNGGITSAAMERAPPTRCKASWTAKRTTAPHRAIQRARDGARSGAAIMRFAFVPLNQRKEVRFVEEAHEASNIVPPPDGVFQKRLFR